MGQATLIAGKTSKAVVANYQHRKYCDVLESLGVVLDEAMDDGLTLPPLFYDSSYHVCLI